MAFDRFDDVRFVILESPEPGLRWGRRGVVAMATVLAAGALAAGAGAHTDGPAAAASAELKKASSKHHGHGCKDGVRRDAGVRY